MTVAVFNDRATCPKCGNEAVATYYMRSRDDAYLGRCRMNGEHETHCPIGEHLHRRCERCSFSWPELCTPQGGKEADSN